MRTNGAAWRRSWEMRVVAWLPIHPGLSGLLFAGLEIALYALVEALFGAPGPTPDVREIAGFSDNLIGFALAALAGGYALAAGYLINARQAAAALDLEPLLGSTVAEHDLLSTVSLVRSRVWGAAGAMAGLLFALNVDEAVADLLMLRGYSTDALSSLVVIPLTFWITLRAIYFTTSGMRCVARAVERSAHIDLIDPARHAPLGRMALHSALLWIGEAVIASFSIWLTAGSIAEFAVIAFLLLTAVASFLMPVRGVQHRIREAKREELSRLRAEIRRDRDALRGHGTDGPEAAVRLPGLLAYEARIEAVREWPFDTPTLVRFALYLAIPLASWLGGALVERVVDRLID